MSHSETHLVPSAEPDSPEEGATTWARFLYHCFIHCSVIAALVLAHSIVLFASMLAPTLVAFIGTLGLHLAPLWGKFIVLVLSYFTGTVALVAGFFLLEYGTLPLREWSLRWGLSASPRNLAAIERPITLLRSFSSDKAHRRITRGRLEEQLYRTIGQVGTFVAIGQPGELLPPIGARRIYVGNERWQERVSDLLRESVLVIYQIGRLTAGLNWELEEIRKVVPGHRLVVALYGPQPHDGVLSEYAAFRQRFNELFGAQLPEDPGKAHFITFEDDFTATLILYEEGVPNLLHLD